MYEYSNKCQIDWLTDKQTDWNTSNYLIDWLSDTPQLSAWPANSRIDVAAYSFADWSTDSLYNYPIDWLAINVLQRVSKASSS